MPRHFVAGVVHASQRGRERVFAHGSIRIAQAREHKAVGFGQRREVAQNSDGLAGEGDDVQFAHLHAGGRDAPFRAIEVDFTPGCLAQFTWPHENKRREF
jgi:hypothetical protein